MAYEFIQELSEARVFRNPTRIEQAQLSAVADNFFNAAMALQIMRYENPRAAQQYAQRTLSGGLDGWRVSGSDFNNMAQILINQDRYSDRVAIDRSVSVPRMQLLGWLRNIAQGREDPESDQRFFLAMQRQLNVRSPGLQAARRLVSDWSRALPDERRLATTRVYNVLRRELGNSDLFAPFNLVASRPGATVDSDQPKSSGIPLWAKAAGAAVAGYYIGRKIGSL